MSLRICVLLQLDGISNILWNSLDALEMSRHTGSDVLLGMVSLEAWMLGKE